MIPNPTRPDSPRNRIMRIGATRIIRYKTVAEEPTCGRPSHWPPLLEQPAGCGLLFDRQPIRHQTACMHRGWHGALALTRYALPTALGTYNDAGCIDPTLFRL